MVRCYITAALNFSLYASPGTERPPLSVPDNGHLNHKEGNGTFNSSCHFKCYFGHLTIGSLPCGVTGAHNGTKPSCSSNHFIFFFMGGAWVTKKSDH